jgi:type I restriction enzyme S subunit
MPAIAKITTWKGAPLSELISEGRGICYGIVQPGEDMPTGIPIIRVNNIRNGIINTDAVMRVSSDIESQYARSRLQGGEVLITLVGTVGEIAIVPPELKDWNVARAVGVIPVNKEIGPYWIKYSLATGISRSHFESRVNTTVQTTLNLRDLSCLRIPLPSRDERRSILGVLQALDDKIDLNRHMNKTLEVMGRAIFKDWFVDFGPVRAKMEGRAPSGLTSDIVGLFPDRLDDEGNPEGWHVGPVGKNFSLTMGQSPPGNTYNKDGKGLPLYQGRTDFGFRYPTRRVFTTSPTRLAKIDDTLVSVRAPVGDLNMAWEPCCVGRGVAAIRHNSGSRSFTYYAMDSIRDDLKAFEHTGTVFGAINKDHFGKLKVCAPTPRVVELFERTVGPFDDLIRVNEGESASLTALRDLLLPQLMSGKIRVKDAENIVGDLT